MYCVLHYDGELYRLRMQNATNRTNPTGTTAIRTTVNRTNTTAILDMQPTTRQPAAHDADRKATQARNVATVNPFIHQPAGSTTWSGI